MISSEASALGTFETLARDYWDFSYQANPTLATELGIHRFDDRLPDASAASLAQQARRLDTWHTRFLAVQDSGLPLSAEVDCALILSDIQTSLHYYHEIRDWKRDPAYYFENALFSLFLLVSRGFAPAAERARHTVARLRQLPDLLAAGRRNLENPPRILIEIALEELEGAYEFCSVTVPAFASRAHRQRRDLISAASAAEKALREYGAFLKHDLVLTAHGATGLGRRRFEALLRADHMLTASAAELQARARQVFDETLEEMRVLAAQIDPVERWDTLLDQARRHHPSPARLLPAYRTELRRLEWFVREHDLVTLPPEECEVVETPSFDRALNAFAAYVGPAPFDRQPRGQFWVTPVEAGVSQAERAERLAEHSTFLYPITAAHEGYPGHHVQFMRANRVPSYTRKHFASSLFAEGWALYCERLMAETGYFQDPRTRLFQLRDRLWRAARVIGEIALHCDGEPLGQVAQFLVREVGMSPTAASAETRRYAAEPTQPLSYLVGELEVLRLRAKFAHLPLKRFHDMLLSSGTLPFRLVEKEMQMQIQTENL